MMKFATTTALGKTWRQYNYMNHAWRLGYEDEMILYAYDLDAAKIHWEAYKHFFDVKGEPTFCGERGDDIVGVQDYYRNPTKAHMFEVFRTYVKPLPKKLSVVYSIIDIKNSEKGIHSKSKNNIIKHLSGFDLGDSRNFKSADELIYKVTQLASAETFVGANCSWAWLCPYFDTVWIELKEGFPGCLPQ